MDIHRLRMSHAVPATAPILEGSDQLLLLRVDADHRVVPPNEPANFGIQIAKLRVAVRMLRPFDRLDVGLQRVVHFSQTACDRDMRHGVAVPRELLRQRAGGFVRPQQVAHRIARRVRLDQAREHVFDVRRGVLDALSAAAGLTNPSRLGSRRRLVALQLRDPFHDGRPRHAGQARQPADGSAPFFERLLGDKHTRLRLIQRAQHAQPVSFRFGHARLRRHPRIVPHHLQDSERLSICKCYCLTVPYFGVSASRRSYFLVFYRTSLRRNLPDSTAGALPPEPPVNRRAD